MWPKKFSSCEDSYKKEQELDIYKKKQEHDSNVKSKNMIVMKTEQEHDSNKGEQKFLSVKGIDSILARTDLDGFKIDTYKFRFMLIIFGFGFFLFFLFFFVYHLCSPLLRKNAFPVLKISITK